MKSVDGNGGIKLANGAGAFVGSNGFLFGGKRRLGALNEFASLDQFRARLFFVERTAAKATQIHADDLSSIGHAPHGMEAMTIINRSALSHEIPCGTQVSGFSVISSSLG